MRTTALFRATVALVLIAGVTSVHAAVQLTMKDTGTLKFATDKAGDLSGEFEHGKQVAIFRSTVSEDRSVFELRDKQGPVLTLAVDKDRVRVTLFTDQLTAVAKRGATPAFDLEGNKGSEAVLERLRANEAYDALPYLAITLVQREISGEKYPASQAIHGMALASAGAQGLKMPELSVPAAAECQDLHGDPNHDACYGMCGNGCTCWRPICGTCCGCEGCQTHDYACRVTSCPNVHLSKLQRLGYHVGCLTFAAFFIPAHPCDRYPTGKYHPPC